MPYPDLDSGNWNLVGDITSPLDTSHFNVVIPVNYRCDYAIVTIHHDASAFYHRGGWVQQVWKRNNDNNDVVSCFKTWINLNEPKLLLLENCQHFYVIFNPVDWLQNFRCTIEVRPIT